MSLSVRVKKASGYWLRPATEAVGIVAFLVCLRYIHPNKLHNPPHLVSFLKPLNGKLQENIEQEALREERSFLAEL